MYTNTSRKLFTFQVAGIMPSLGGSERFWGRRTAGDGLQTSSHSYEWLRSSDDRFPDISRRFWVMLDNLQTALGHWVAPYALGDSERHSEDLWTALGGSRILTVRTAVNRTALSRGTPQLHDIYCVSKKHPRCFSL